MPPARHTDQRQSISQNFSLKNLAKNHAEHLQTSHDYQYIKYILMYIHNLTCHTLRNEHSINVP